jgi:hypothetical protein
MAARHDQDCIVLTNQNTSHLQFHSRRHHDRPETQRMGADGCDHDGRHAGVYHGGARRHRVRGAPRRGTDDQAVSLHRRDVLPVEEQVDVGEVRRRSPVNHHLVQHQQVGRLLARLLLVVALAHHDTPQTAAQGEGGVAFQNVVHLLLEIVELERRQEAQRAQVEGHHGRHRLLEQVTGVQEGAVTAQADDEVYLVGEVVLAVAESHQLVLDVGEGVVLVQEGVVEDGRFDEHQHPLFLNKKKSSQNQKTYCIVGCIRNTKIKIGCIDYRRQRVR